MTITHNPVLGNKRKFSERRDNIPFISISFKNVFM